MLLLALIPALLAGCGGDGEGDGGGESGGGSRVTETATFEDGDFGVTFEYPADFETLDDVTFSRSAGSAADATAAVGLDSDDLLALQRFDLETEVTGDNLRDVRREADTLFSQLSGQQVRGEETRVGGLPALEYDLDLEEPPDAETRAVAIFDGSVQYLLNCQSTPEGRERIRQACRLALDTLSAE